MNTLKDISESDIAAFYSRTYPKHDDALILKFQVLIENSYKSGFDPKHYSDQLAISYRQLSRLTSRKLGCTPNEYLQSRLLKEAERFLKYTDIPVKQICYELGMCDPSFFSKWFKKLRGKSPVTFREQERLK